MTQREMAEAAKKRSPNYFDMSAEEQWEEDKRLGILDWDGTSGEEDERPSSNG